MTGLTIEELAQRLDVHVDIARRAAENLLAKGLIEEVPQSAALSPTEADKP
ncbi:hypothetical protein [Azospirillum sp. TSA2s]|uniref:hypothetical protein n=1 Tax=Azospirillum sp. TSA2s TaxID=709810 RepID=UPI00145AABB6|nr:hypothetical protein [Azospirillum sp. TSA2s]